MKKTAKLILAMLLSVIVLLPALTACNKDGTASGATDETLVVYNWEDYIDPDTRDGFADYYEERTGRSLSITYSTFDTNETMMTKVLKNDANVDLIAPSDYAIQKLMAAGKLKNLSKLKQAELAKPQNAGITFDNWENTEPGILTKINDVFGEISAGGNDTALMTDYMIPYMWGTLGILYNTKYVTPEELEEYGWGILWNKGKNPKIEDKILMKDSIRDTFVAGLCYLKECGNLPKAVSSIAGKTYDELSIEQLINCTDQTLLDAVEVVLTEQREHISGYEVDFGKDDMINEIVYLDLAWSGDALWAIEEGGERDDGEMLLDYYVPEVGSNIWYDGWVIPTTVKNPLAALMFIDYMNAPINGISNSMEIGYTSAVAKEKMQADEDVCAFLTENEYDIEEYFGDLRRYPEFTDTLGVMKDFGARNEACVQMWERVKVGKGTPWELIYCMIALVGVVGIGVAAYAIKERIKRRSRKPKTPKTLKLKR